MGVAAGSADAGQIPQSSGHGDLIRGTPGAPDTSIATVNLKD